jgi:hypothetical protein
MPQILIPVLVCQPVRKRIHYYAPYSASFLILILRLAPAPALVLNPGAPPVLGHPVGRVLGPKSLLGVVRQTKGVRRALPRSSLGNVEVVEVAQVLD